MIRSRTSWLGGLLLLAAVAAPARAGDLDKFLPEDTESVVTFNFRQLLDSALVKKYGLEHAKEALKNADEINDVLKDLGFDPFKDLDVVIIAGPASGEQDKGLIIAHGKFDVDKFKAKADDAVKNNGDVVKVHKSGTNLIYEVKIPDQEQTLFVALAGKDTILASPGKDYVIDGLKKVDAKKNTGLKNKQVQAMIEKMDAKQTLSIALVGEGFAKADLPDPKMKALLAKIDAVSGGLTISDEVKLEIGITTKTAADAKEINKAINDGLNQGLVVLGLLAANNESLVPVMDFVKSVKATAKDKAVVIKAAISAEALEKALNKKDF